MRGVINEFPLHELPPQIDHQLCVPSFPLIVIIITRHSLSLYYLVFSAVCRFHLTTTTECVFAIIIVDARLSISFPSIPLSSKMHQLDFILYMFAVFLHSFTNQDDHHPLMLLMI
jgi:hypothetical protein